MASDKKISPRSAGIEVLKKFLSLSIKAEQEGKPSLFKQKKETDFLANTSITVLGGSPTATESLITLSGGGGGGASPDEPENFSTSDKDSKKMQKSEDLNKKYEGFKAVEASAAKSGASDPAAVAAAAGRKKYGKEAFQEAAAEGKKMGKSEMGPEWEAKRTGLLHAKGAAESKKKDAHAKLIAPMSLKQYTTHIYGKKHADYTVPAGSKHSQNLKDFHVANEEHKNAIKAYKDHMASDTRIAKSESNPDEKEDAKLGEKVEEDVNQHQEENKEAEQKEAHVKGHYKLAKFIGYMEGKRSKMGAQGPAGGVLENQSHEQEMGDSGNNEPTKKIDHVAVAVNKSETGHEKAINTSTDPSQKSRVMMGTSKAGSTLPGHANDPIQRVADESEAKGKHKQVLNEMKQMPKPKLPK